VSGSLKWQWNNIEQYKTTIVRMSYKSSKLSAFQIDHIE